jgi:hypothetical protein
MDFPKRTAICALLVLVPGVFAEAKPAGPKILVPGLELIELRPASDSATKPPSNRDPPN